MNVCLKNLSLWRRWMVVYLDDPAGSQALIYLRVLLKCDLDTAVTRSSSPDFSLPLWEIAVRHSINDQQPCGDGSWRESMNQAFDSSSL
jgi:hypothetical protein